MQSGLVAFIIESGNGFFKATQALLRFNYQVVALAHALVWDSCKILAAVGYSFLESVKDISLYIWDLLCELLNLGAALWRVLLKLLLIVFHIGLVFWNGLELSAKYIASWIVSGLQLTYQFLCNAGEYLGISYKSIKVGLYFTKNWIENCVSAFHELCCQCSLWMISSLNSFCCNLTNHIPAPGPFFFGILLGVCMISIVLLVIKILDQSGVSVPTIQIVNVRGIRVQNYQIRDDFDMVVSDEEDGVNNDDNYNDDQSNSGRTESSDISTDFTDSEVEEFEIDTDTSEDGFQDENDENDRNQINVQLPERTGRYGLRSQQSPLQTISSNAEELSPKQLQSFIEAENQRKLCVICKELPKNVLVLPCRHMCMCIDCAHEVVSQRNRQRRTCPLCRSAIETIMDVYI